MEKTTIDVKADTEELKKYIEDLLNNNLEKLTIKDPNFIIKDLEFKTCNSRDRGWSGSLANIQECKVKNCPLSSLLLIMNEYEVLINIIIGGNPIKSIKGDFIEYFRYSDGKDSHNINRYTYKSFYPSHLLATRQIYVSDENKKLESYMMAYNSLLDLKSIEKDQKCGFYEVQYKSSLYTSNNEEDLYKDGHIDNISDCSSSQIVDITDKILKSYDYNDHRPKKVMNKKG